MTAAGIGSSLPEDVFPSLTRAAELVCTLHTFDCLIFQEAWSLLCRSEEHEGAPLTRVTVVGGLLLHTLRRAVMLEAEHALSATSDGERAAFAISAQSFARLLSLANEYEHLWTLKLVRELVGDTLEPPVVVGKA